MREVRRYEHSGFSVAEYRLGLAERCLYVLDQVIESAAHATVQRFFQTLEYSFSDIDGDESAHVRHLRRDFSDGEVSGNPLLSGIAGVAQGFLRQQQDVVTVVDEMYANFNLFGDFQFAHADGPVWTALLFTNDTWEAHWAGEFLAYDEQAAGIAMSIEPRPGRLLVFDGQIVHRGGAPSKHCLIPRVTLACKLVVKESGHAA